MKNETKKIPMSTVEMLIIVLGIFMGIGTIGFIQYRAYLYELSQQVSRKTTPVFSPTPPLTGVPKKVEVFISNTAFIPSQIHAFPGEILIIHITNTQGYHNFIVKGFKNHSGNLSTGKQTTVILPIIRLGEYPFYSATGKYSEKEPTGVLLVTP